MAKKPEILLIEGNAEERKALRKQLSDAGFHVCATDQSSSAVELAHDRMPHVLVLDLSVNDPASMEYVRYHFNLKDLKDIPLILISDIDHLDAVSDAILLGAADSVTKPFEPQTLIDKIKKAYSERTPKYEMAFSDPNQHQITGRFPCHMLAVSNSGMTSGTLLETHAHIPPLLPSLRLHIPLLKRVHPEPCTLTRSHEKDEKNENGYYTSESRFITPESKTLAKLVRILVAPKGTNPEQIFLSTDPLDEVPMSKNSLEFTSVSHYGLLEVEFQVLGFNEEYMTLVSPIQPDRGAIFFLSGNLLQDISGKRVLVPVRAVRADEGEVRRSYITVAEFDSSDYDFSALLRKWIAKTKIGPTQEPPK